MFYQIENGTSIDIQGLICHLPPVGYIVDIKTGLLEYRGVSKRSDIPEEQYWDKPTLPSWYKKIIQEEDNYEKKKKEDSPPFYNADYENFKEQEWDKRLNGLWVMINGTPIYLTGMHYLYLTWWKIDIGSPKFRITDLEYFYFLLYCIEDPECMGMIEICKRRSGKSFRSGLFIMEYITRTKMANGGIQSKTGADAKKLFGKAVVRPFKKLPRFFRPEYDMSLGITPKTEVRFEQTNVRGKKAEDTLGKDELGSMADHQNADEMAYDGQKLQRYVSDEWAKTKEANIYDRHEVIRYCLLDDEGKIIGKALYTTTVEKLDSDKDGIQEAARLLWDESDHMNKKETGRTPSGLYRYFMTSDRSKNFDIYGYPDIQKTVTETLADRESVKHNKRALAARIRKEARTIEEAFYDDGEECIFNIININNQKAHLRNNPITHFRYLHYYRDLDQVVKYRDIDPDKTDLYWKMLYLPPDGQQNKFNYEDGFRKPGRADIGVIGVDGYSNSQGGKIYGSKLSGWVFLKFDIRDPENTGMFVGHIYGRPSEKEDMYNQILLAAEYLGFTVYIEFASDDYYSFFKNRGRLKYLGKFPKASIEPNKLKTGKVERHYGFPTTEFALTKQNDVMMTYVEHYCGKILYIELLDDLPKFRPYKRTPSDRTVSAMITLVSSMELTTKPKRKIPLITVYPNEGRQNTLIVDGRIQKN